MICGIVLTHLGKSGMNNSEQTLKQKFWKNKNVFVTGANGFLGSWICSRLVNYGSHVIGLERDFFSNSYLVLTETDKKIDLITGCLEDYHLVERILNEFDINICFHLGAQPIVITANRFPLSTFESNIRGTWNLLEAIRRNGKIERVVVSSSDKAYGSKEKMPYTEQSSLEGMNPYDFSKTCTDLLAQLYFKSYGLPIGIARCGNFFGPGDLNYSRIVPGTIRSLINNENPIIRSDGNYMRDYFYIEDVVDAYLVLAEQLHRVRGEAFNFGTEKPISVKTIVKKIISISEKTQLKPIILNNSSGEIKIQYLSCKKAYNVLRWKFKTPLEDALQTTYKWYENLSSSTS